MSDFDDIIAGLRHPDAYPHRVDRVEHIETHISHILLAGDYAYKLKKPLDLGFLDFSTLERRRFCCEEENRLNRRLAPDIYLGVVTVTGTPRAPRIGGAGEALEHAVRMRRFDQEGLLTRMPVTPELADRIAERVAAFHDSIPSAAVDSPFGRPELVQRPMEENFAHIRERLSDPAGLRRLEPLADWTRARLRELTPLIESRRRGGQIRECHGDMHRGNIALVQGELIIFDGIEFNPALRWIDTMSELAFLVMDLEEAGEAPQARRLLNRYLELRGDYAGLALLDFYKVYRAMVRAKVTRVRLGQSDLGPDEAARDRADYEGYIALAEGYTRPRPRRLYLTHGVSGSGKSRLALRLRDRLPVIHIRSDLERKRLFGLPPDARTRSAKDAGIYSREAGDRTYARLRELAAGILDAGYSPLVDATFLERARRRSFIELAEEKACPCTILVPEAPEPVLRRRVQARELEGGEPSEADLAILEAQLAAREPLTAAEQELALRIDTLNPPELEDLLARWPR